MMGKNVSTELANLLGPVIKQFASGGYELPTFKGKKVFYFIPLSGGIDSFATAYTLLALYPSAPFTFIHADTGVEAEGTADALARFEQITGRKVLKLIPKRDLLEQIESQGNFLPSVNARFCTQLLKTVPIQKFYNALKERHGDDCMFLQFVGLRADEPLRKGIDWSQDHIASAYPLQALGLRKPDVNKIVHQIQKIPFYYLDKTRSGCSMCIFMRRSEVIDSWIKEPVKMERAAKMEEMPANALRIYNALPTPVGTLVGASRNWLNYYRPAALGYHQHGYEGRRGKNKLQNNMDDMFGASEAKKLYAAIEFHYYGNTFGIAAENHVFYEKLITYSTSLGGAKTALKHFWKHRLDTAELYEMTGEKLSEERRVFIFELEVDDFDNEIPPTPEGTFTWQNDKTSLYAIRKTKAVIERILLSEGEKQATASADPHIRKSAERSVEILKGQKCYGRVLNVQEYEKPTAGDLYDDFDIKSAPTPCLSCSR